MKVWQTDRGTLAVMTDTGRGYVLAEVSGEVKVFQEFTVDYPR